MTKYFIVARCDFRGDTREHMRMDMLLLAFPAEKVEFAEGEEHQRPSGEEGNETHCAPENWRRWMGVLPALGSYGKLFVYEYGLPGRLATEAQAVQAKMRSVAGVPEDP